MEKFKDIIQNLPTDAKALIGMLGLGALFLVYEICKMIFKLEKSKANEAVKAA